MFGFSSIRCNDCTNLDKHDRNKYGEAYCPIERDYVRLDSPTCRYFDPNFYVMTAYCKIKKIPYDCNEMSILIALRDEYMMNNQEGLEFLKDYENIGPILAARLVCDIYRTDVVKTMKEEYIIPAVNFSIEGRKEEAQKTYMQMVEMLKVRYGYAPLEKTKTKDFRF